MCETLVSLDRGPEQSVQAARRQRAAISRNVRTLGAKKCGNRRRSLGLQKKDGAKMEQNTDSVERIDPRPTPKLVLQGK